MPGNHDVKLVRKLRGKNVRIAHGLAETLADIDSIPEDQQTPFRKQLIDFIEKNYQPSEREKRLHGIRVELSGDTSNVVVKNLTNFTVLNLSQSRIFIETDQKLDTGDTCWLEMNLPDEEATAIKFRGEVSSCFTEPDKTPPLDVTGIDIVSIDRNAKDKLREFVRTLQQR